MLFFIICFNWSLKRLDYLAVTQVERQLQDEAMSPLASQCYFICQRITLESSSTEIFSLGDRRWYLAIFWNSTWPYLKTISMCISLLLLPCSIQNQRLTYQDHHLRGHLLSLHLPHFPTGEVCQYPHPGFVSMTQSCGKMFPLWLEL